MCDKSYVVQMLYIIKTILNSLCYLVPSIIIIVSMISFGKVVVSGKEEDFKAAFSILFKRLIAGIAIFLLPSIVTYIFKDVAETDTSLIACMQTATLEKVNSLKEKEEKEKAYQKEVEQAKARALEKEYYENEKAKSERREETEKETQKDVTITNNGISVTEFNNKLSGMNTPTINEIEKVASQNGIDSNYLVIIIGTTANEGYYNDPYLSYGWASAMINNPVTIAQMQGWDPSHTGEANYYSQTNINRGYNNASSDVLKAVYIALTNRNTKIIECNGMYSTTPSNYNKIYTSGAYSNISIYETK